MRASKILKIASRVLLVLVAVLNAGCSSENRAEIFRVLAEQGDAEAQNNLGKCYREGIGVSQDYAEAAKWFQRSAEQGNADAQNNLGACYHTGTGVPLSHSEAVKWYRLSAEQGYDVAQYNLGRCYLGNFYKLNTCKSTNYFVFSCKII